MIKDSNYLVTDIKQEHDMPENKTYACRHSFSGKIIQLKLDGTSKIECGCGTFNGSSIIWLDERCNEIKSGNKTFSRNENGRLKISVDDDDREEWKVLCTNGHNCSNAIMITHQKEPVSKIEPGLLAFVIILIVAILLILSWIVYKKFRRNIYLCCRDTCAGSTIKDGKEFDAYISIGKSETDLKFVERNIVSILQEKYGHKFFIDEENLIPKLDFSERVQSKIRKCRRLIIFFTPAYMNHDWCKYCFSEGLRKLLELNMRMIFIIGDDTIKREINSLSSLVGHVPKISISFLSLKKTQKEREEITKKLRLYLPPSRISLSQKRGMKTSMLSEADDLDERSTCADSEAPKEVSYSILENTSTAQDEEDDVVEEGVDYKEIDPNAIKVHSYKAKKGFYSITAMGYEDD